MKQIKFALVAGVASLAMPASAANLIVNGDFQTPGTDPVPFWIVTPGGEISAGTHGFFGGPPTNSYVAFGGGNAANISTLDQTVQTVAGGSYELKFKFGSYGYPGNTLTAQVLDSTNAVIASNAYHPGYSYNYANLFTPFALNFTGPGGATTVRFFVDAYSFNTDGVLDDVQLIGPSTVPEPASWAMLIGGFGLAGAAMRRRRRAVFA